MDATTVPIRLGSILFTMVEPKHGHEVSYNRWYERDHFYSGVMIGGYAFAGRRWVATRPYKELRYPADSKITPDPMVGSYLATYWVLDGHHDEWNRWAVRQVKELHAAGRMFAEREHIHTQLYRYAFGVFRDADGVPAELALDHPFRGLVAVVGRTAEGVERDRVLEWYRTEHLPRALAGSSAAMCLTFSPIPLEVDAPGVPKSEDDDVRFLQMYFLDRDPAEVWHAEFAKLGEELAATGLGEILFASPFIPTIPGSDAYTDQLR